MKRIEKKVAWTSKDGKAVEVSIIVERGMEDVIAYADGYNIKTGERAVDSTTVTMKIDGKVVAKAYNAPSVITAKTHGAQASKMISAGAYASIEKACISKEIYEKIMNAIAEVDAECPKIVVEVKKTASAAPAKGVCPICQTYCAGTCR